MITEHEAKEIFESFRRCQRKNQDDQYWAGAVSAMKAVLEIDRLEHELNCWRGVKR